jgi:hypothetical protein
MMSNTEMTAEAANTFMLEAFKEKLTRELIATMEEEMRPKLLDIAKRIVSEYDFDSATHRDPTHYDPAFIVNLIVNKKTEATSKKCY